MARVLLVRAEGALAILSLALFIIGVVPFLSADPTAGAGLTGKNKNPYTVNHEFKGDRLPLSSDGNPAVARSERAMRLHARMPDEVPVGCDLAFSPVSAPRMAYFYGRCMT
jgi:hypothetical protein